MKQWIKDIYINHLKYKYPINHLQMFKTLKRDLGEFYIHGNPKPVNHFTIEQGIEEYIINAKVD